MLILELDEIEAKVLLMLLQGIKLTSAEQRELCSVEAQLEAGVNHADN